MNKRATILMTIITLAAGAALFLVLRNNDSGTAVPPAGNGSGPTTAPIQTEMVRVSTPLPNTLVNSPLSVSGQARGNWFFEASFPIRILDANGRELGRTAVQAQGDWMTTDFVPFSGTVSFSNPTTETGTLVLEKDNPSGLPQNAAEVKVPIRFSGQSSAQTRAVKLYFYNENRDRDASGNILCSSQGLVAFDRVIPLTNTPLQDAIRELLKGPTAAERVRAPNTEFPLAGLSLTGASLSNGLLTLSFNDPQNKTGGGSCRVNILRAQIESTAKQFPGVNSVRFLPAELFQP